MACGHYYHVPCVSQWLVQGKTTTTCLVDVSSSIPKLSCINALRRQKAVARWVQDSYNSGYMCSQPPEVRVSRISLEQRRRRQPPLSSLGTTPAILLPPKPLKPPRKKRQRRLGELQSSDRLPVSVTESRALSVQVQPLMAVLMSPRNLEDAQNLLTGENVSLEQEEKEESTKRPLLSITSLELPEMVCLPGKAMRPPPKTPCSRRLARRAASHPLPSFTPGCSKISLSPRRIVESPPSPEPLVIS